MGSNESVTRASSSESDLALENESEVLSMTQEGFSYLSRESVRSNQETTSWSDELRYSVPDLEFDPSTNLANFSKLKAVVAPSSSPPNLEDPTSSANFHPMKTALPNRFCLVCFVSVSVDENHRNSNSHKKMKDVLDLEMLPFVCMICNRRFHCETNLSIHTENYCSKRNVNDRLYCCYMCKVVHENITDWFDHMSSSLHEFKRELAMEVAERSILTAHLRLSDEIARLRLSDDCPTLKTETSSGRQDERFTQYSSSKMSSEGGSASTPGSWYGSGEGHGKIISKLGKTSGSQVMSVDCDQPDPSVVLEVKDPEQCKGVEGSHGDQYEGIKTGVTMSNYCKSSQECSSDKLVKGFEELSLFGDNATSTPKHLGGVKYYALSESQTTAHSHLETLEQSDSHEFEVVCGSCGGDIKIYNHDIDLSMDLHIQNDARHALAVDYPNNNEQSSNSNVDAIQHTSVSGTASRANRHENGMVATSAHGPLNMKAPMSLSSKGEESTSVSGTDTEYMSQLLNFIEKEQSCLQNKMCVICNVKVFLGKKQAINPHILGADHYCHRLSSVMKMKSMAECVKVLRNDKKMYCLLSKHIELFKMNKGLLINLRNIKSLIDRYIADLYVNIQKSTAVSVNSLKPGMKLQGDEKDQEPSQAKSVSVTATKKHLKFYCNLCNISISIGDKMPHCMGKKHKAKLVAKKL